MPGQSHIPQLKTITDFYRQLRIGTPLGDDFSIMRIEDQPESKLAEMPLFRSNFYRIVFFTNEGVQFQLGEKQLESTGNSIYFGYPGKLESWYTSRKISGYLVCFTEAFAHIDATHSSFMRQFPFFNFEGNSLIQFTQQESEVFQNTLRQMLAEIRSVHADRHDMIRHLLHQYLIQIRRVYREKLEAITAEAGNSTHIFNQFQKAIHEYFAQLAENTDLPQASVSTIASKLSLNPSYLNTVVKTLTDKTASTFIHHQTLLEAKSYLMHTDLQVAEISHRLGFTNVSYFNRFFKRLSSQTPLEFRDSKR